MADQTDNTQNSTSSSPSGSGRALAISLGATAALLLLGGYALRHRESLAIEAKAVGKHARLAYAGAKQKAQQAGAQHRAIKQSVAEEHRGQVHEKKVQGARSELAKAQDKLDRAQQLVARKAQRLQTLAQAA